MAIGIDWLYADMVGTRIDMFLHSRFYRVGAAPGERCVDESIAQIIDVLFGHTHAQPIVAVIWQSLINLSNGPSQLPRFARLRFEYDFLFAA